MIGGRVIEVRPEGDKTRIWVVDTQVPFDEAAIYVFTQSEMPEVGDSVWWQGRKAYWTPVNRRFLDRPLDRFGSSFDPTRAFITNDGTR